MLITACIIEDSQKKKNRAVCPAYDIASLCSLRLQITIILPVKYFCQLLAFYAEMKH
jgi:hypothetical protein